MTTVYLVELTNGWSDYDRGEPATLDVCTSFGRAKDVGNIESGGVLDWHPYRLMTGRIIHWYADTAPDTRYHIYPMELDYYYHGGSTE